MNRFSFVKDGVTRLPPGFRFQPTEEELVFRYLKCKVFSCPLPASIIPEINVCKYDPWDIPGQPEEDRYFFSYKEAKHRNGNRMNRSTNSGYWKATGSDKRINSSPRRSNDSIVGIRKTLVFYEGKSPYGTRTDWVMHEYRLLSNGTTNLEKEVGEWVLCRLFMKKRSGDSANQDTAIQNGNRMVESMEVAQPKYYNFMVVHGNGAGPVLSSTSSSSCFNSMTTEVTSNCVSEFEETGGYTY